MTNETREHNAHAETHRDREGWRLGYHAICRCGFVSTDQPLMRDAAAIAREHRIAEYESRPGAAGGTSMTTPTGPWHVEHPYDEPGTYISNASTALIARVYEDGSDGWPFKPCGEANARLIAAAPELLAMVRDLKQFVPSNFFIRRDDIDKLIAKASS